MKVKLRIFSQNVNYLKGFRPSRLFSAPLIAIVVFMCPAILHAADEESGEVRILQIQGKVELMPAGTTRWVLTQTNEVLRAGDRLRSGSNSRVTLRWSDQSVVPFGALTEIEVVAPDTTGSLPGLNVIRGVISFFHRDKPGRIRIFTRGARAGVEGTEFVMEVTETNGGERVTLSVIDGAVNLSNAQGALLLTNNEQGVIEPGRAPTRTPGFIANNILQWCFYYPGVLDLKDLSPGLDTEALKPSLEAYRAGDLNGALAKYPETRQPATDSEKIYHAALLLSVGQVEQTETELASLSGAKSALADSLRVLIAAVKRERRPATPSPQLATELLAASYYEQSRATGEESLKAALELARRATTVSPEFGFAWERVAELEFGFGRTREAEAALNKSIALSPRNAQALALKGFILAAQNRIGEATGWFDRAIATDAGLGNAWLGRGLCRIRRGDRAAGRADLLVAAALEPQRSLLRSYLGKAFTDAGESALAHRELELALRLDANDPTGWLYSALLKQQENQPNPAIRDLEQSQALNDNRSLFRSQMLLDQDKAVRSANLAGVYRDAGMSEVATREAARAVTYDYANDAAHLFLSDSFNELRDPTRFNLRQETVWFNELLLANLLAPVGAGRLSQTLSAQEYSKLFESDGLGLAAQGSWRSDEQYHQLASQYGTMRNTSWALDLDYQHNNGVRPNNELDRIEWYTTIKQQLTPADSLLVLVKYQDYSSGDNFQYYNPSASYRPNFSFEEHQHPIVVGGYQHEWSPGVRTLMLGGRLANEQKFSDLQAGQLLLFGTAPGVIAATDVQPFDITIENEMEIYTAELNQIVQRDRFTIVAGALWQSGNFDFENQLVNPPLPPFLLPPVSASFSEPFNRYEGYAYLTIEPIEKVWLTGGVSYDYLKMPANYRTPPLSAGTEERHRLGPKAAIVWSPIAEVTLRGIYSQTLGGVSLDQSYRLEPTQLAGFPQAFRTVISESLVGSVAGPEHDVMGAALDLKFGMGTYVGLQVDRVTSDVERTIGVFRIQNSAAPYLPSTTGEDLNYEENSFSITANQLLGNGFVAGASYRVTRSELESTLPEIPVAVLPGAARDESAWLHQIGGYLLYNHPSGFFARFDARYYQQSNRGYTPDQPGDEFVQLDLQAGYRCFRRRVELAVGILNLTDQDYRLNPLTPYNELPRERVFAARFSFRF